MDMELRYLLKALVLPPTLFLVIVPFILFVGYVLFKRIRHMIFVLFCLNISCLWLFSTPGFALWLTKTYDQTIEPLRLYDRAATQHLSEPRSAVYTDVEAQAIVLLGGGKDLYAPEFPLGQQLSQHSILRTYYAGFLVKQLQLPILVSGGVPFKDGVSEAVLMESFLNHLDVSVSWLENNSLNTEQNAINTAKLLQEEGISSILLVSSAYHLKRAKLLFEQQGFQVALAPTDFYGIYSGVSIPWFKKWLPDLEALQQVRRVLHEMLGQWYYKIR